MIDKLREWWKRVRRRIKGDGLVTDYEDRLWKRSMEAYNHATSTAKP